MFLRLALIALIVCLAVLGVIVFILPTLSPSSTTPPPKTASSQPAAPQSPVDEAPAHSQPGVAQDQAVPRGEAHAQPSAANGNTTDATKKMAELRKAIEALPKGNIVLDAPSKMAVGDEREVKASVGINVPISELRKQSVPSDQQVEGSLYLSPQMAATLSGPGFTIEQITPKKQSIAEGFPTIWTWNVTAKQEGEQKLEATLYVLVGDGNETGRIRVESYAQTISVSVRPQTWGEWLDSVSHGLGTIQTIVIAIGAIVTAVLGWFGIRSRKRSQKSLPEKPNI